jgi:hypothetical protein
MLHPTAIRLNKNPCPLVLHAGRQAKRSETRRTDMTSREFLNTAAALRLSSLPSCVRYG